MKTFSVAKYRNILSGVEKARRRFSYAIFFLSRNDTFVFGSFLSDFDFPALRVTYREKKTVQMHFVYCHGDKMYYLFSLKNRNTLYPSNINYQ